METPNFYEGVRKRISLSWKFFMVLLPVLFLLPLVLISESENVPGTDRLATKYKTLYVIIIMSIYWALEILPLPVTALLPLLLFPALGVQKAYIVSQNYTKESNIIFLGGVIIALGIEFCGLHNRIALRVMTIFGSSPVQLLLATMSSVALLSMWLSATSCVAILVPVICAIIDEIHESPEILSESEVRRISKAEESLSINYNPNGYANPRNEEQLGSGSPHLRSRRRSSSTNTTFINLGRRNTTVFGNLGLSSSHQPYQDVELEHGRNISSSRLNSHSHLSERDARRAENDRRSSVGFSDKVSNHSGSAVNINIIIDEAEEDELAKEKEKQFMEMEEKQKKRNEIKKMFLFGMAYAANIGGTSVITGTSPNKIFKEVIKPVEVSQGGKYTDITFFVWMALNVPAMLINIIIAWFYLSTKYYGLPNRSNWPFLRRICCCFKKHGGDDDPEEDIYHWRSREVSIFLNKEYQKLGRITVHEISVLIVFLIVVILWIFREPVVIDGWGNDTPNGKSGDSTSAIFGVILLFIIPKNWSFLFGKNKDNSKYEALLDWKFITSRFPWGVLLLLGSGFAIADASSYSGLSDWLGQELELLSEIPNAVLLLIVVVLTNALTNFVSSVACANVILPVIVSVSRSLNIHPFYLTVPIAVTCQYAFLFPVATPSNTIVFAAGNFTTMEMVKTGLFLNLICIAILYINTITYGNWWFDYGDYIYSNVTTTSNNY